MDCGKPRLVNDVTFGLEDADHFWFHHSCNDVAKRWADGGHPLEPDTAAFFQQSADTRTLPLGGPKGWQLVSRDPLTISPSVLCGECKVHGFITDGKWVPC